MSTETAVMTDEEAKEVITRSPAEEIVPDAVPLPEGVTTERTQGEIGMFHALSQIGEGVYVAWDTCRRCNLQLRKCECKTGPMEPGYITKWREEFLGKPVKTKKEKETPVQVAVPDPVLTDKVDQALEAALEAVEGVEPTDVGEPLAPSGRPDETEQAENQTLKHTEFPDSEEETNA